MAAGKGPTGYRKFRAPTDLWKRFGDAVEAGPDPEADMSKVLRQFIRWYVGETNADLPKQPPKGPWSTPDTGEQA
ncbi:hypothetical protein GTY88_16900 [Streptomyces sp. SID5926]|nr:hypothetical protein [Streptomyces sp. SID5926]